MDEWITINDVHYSAQFCVRSLIPYLVIQDLDMLWPI